MTSLISAALSQSRLPSIRCICQCVNHQQSYLGTLVRASTRHVGYCVDQIYWLLIRYTGRHTGGEEPTLWLKLEAYKTDVSIDQVCYLGKLNSKDLLVFQVHEEAVHQQLVVDVSSSCSKKKLSELFKLERRRVQNCNSLCIPFHILESLSIS